MIHPLLTLVTEISKRLNFIVTTLQKYNAFCMSLCVNGSIMTSVMYNNSTKIQCTAELVSDRTISTIRIITMVRSTVQIYSLKESSNVFFKALSKSIFSFATPKYSFLLSMFLVCLFLITFVHLDKVRSTTDIITRITVNVTKNLRVT